MIKNGRKNKLTVRVTGSYFQGEDTAPIVESNNIKEDTNPEVNVNKEKEDGNFFKNMKKVNDIGVDSSDVAHIIMVEFKRVYIGCLVGQKFSVDDLDYLDNLVFNSMESVIKQFIDKNSKEKMSCDQIQDTINHIIRSSIELLDYESEFDFKKMYAFVSEFATYFTE